MDHDYEAMADMDAMRRAREIEGNPARVMQLRRHIEAQQAMLDEMGKMLPEAPKRRFNKAVKDSHYG